MPITDEQLDAILGQNDNLIEVATRLHERKRKLAHAKAKADQPRIDIRGTEIHDGLMGWLKGFWDAPVTEDEKSCAQGDIEYLILTLQDCVDAGDVEDVIFAALRISRKMMARNPHLWRKQDIQEKK
jgi:hypothetical protein